MSLVSELIVRTSGKSPKEKLTIVRDLFPGKVAMTSAFGAESALGLHAVHDVDRHLPVITVDTGQHFEATRIYRATLIEFFKLTNVQVFYPDQAILDADDPHGNLWEKDDDACCYVRKRLPFSLAIRPYQVIVTGRMRIHGGMRKEMAPIEEVFYDGVPYIRVNLIAEMTEQDLEAEFTVHETPRHPLAGIYTSIGCAPCTYINLDPNDPRGGRAELDETRECGMHPPPKPEV